MKKAQEDCQATSRLTTSLHPEPATCLPRPLGSAGTFQNLTAVSAPEPDYLHRNLLRQSLLRHTLRTEPEKSGSAPNLAWPQYQHRNLPKPDLILRAGNLFQCTLWTLEPSLVRLHRIAPELFWAQTFSKVFWGRK